MRDAAKIETFRAEDGTPLCVVLPGAYCAEHEMGVAGLLGALRVPAYDDRTTVGVEARTMAGPCDRARFETLKDKGRVGYGRTAKKPDVAVLLVHRFLDEGREDLSTPWHFDDGDAIRGRWGQDGFVLAAVGAGRAVLEDLHAAILAQDLAAWFGMFERNPFAKPGLALAVAGRVPEALRTAMRENDEARIRLARDVETIGVVERVATAAAAGALGLSGRSWYGHPPVSLHPSRLGEGFTIDRDGSPVELKSAYDVRFFANSGAPDFPFGWYTVEELDDWIVGRGVVPERMAGKKATG